MKILNALLVVFALSILVSCDFTKNNSPNQSTEGRTVPENKEITNTNNYKKTGNFDEIDENVIGSGKVVDSLNENWNLDNPKRKENLYSEFNMTKAQITSYEKALQTWKESEKDDAYQTLSANEKIKEEDKILKDILDDNQYKQYKKWAGANDKRG